MYVEGYGLVSGSSAHDAMMSKGDVAGVKQVLHQRVIAIQHITLHKIPHSRLQGLGFRWVRVRV